MYISAHHISQAIVYQAMPFDTVFAFETGRYQAQAVVAAAGSGAGVPGMPGRFVFKAEFERREGAGQQRADTVFAIIAHCVSLICFDRKKLCAIAKAKIRPVKPNNLKLTQVESGKLKAT